jgi:hypothetical protein
MASSKITLETLRQLGICNHYNKQIALGLDAESALYDASVFGNISIKQTKKILNGETANSKKFGGIGGTEILVKWLR